jgi:hypothetical protein
MFTSAGATAYACSKAAQVALAKMAALELAPHRVRVNVVFPGMIATAIGNNTWQRRTEAATVPVDYPTGRIPLTGGAHGTSEDVAELNLFLTSERSRDITGTPVWIDGRNRCWSADAAPHRRRLAAPRLARAGCPGERGQRKRARVGGRGPRRRYTSHQWAGRRREH